MSPFRFLPSLVATSVALGCGAKTANTPDAPMAMATVPAAFVDGAMLPSAASSAPPASATPAASLESTTAGGSPPTAASGSPTAATPGSSTAEVLPMPSVKVVNIGMHIGGGPNDAATKAPIRRSVEPHFDELRRCYGLLGDQNKGGDFGLDLRINRGGGVAALSHVRTTLPGKAFKDCVIHTFERIEFRKPLGGTTTVSYSLRFTP